MFPRPVTLQRSSSGLISLWLLMIRVIARQNGTSEPAVALKIDTAGDAVTAKAAFVDEAAQLLEVQRTVPINDVGIFLPGGAAINLKYLEKGMVGAGGSCPMADM